MRIPLLDGLDKYIAQPGLVFRPIYFLQTFHPDGTKLASLGTKCL
jgi:hypothetical protein